MNRKILLAITVVVATVLVGCATTPEGGDAPRVSIQRSNRTYISPNASPGIKDSFVSSITATPGTEDAVLQHFEMNVTDGDGNVVYSLEGSVDETQELIPDPTPLFVPRQISWTGTDEDGNYVDDGIYFVSVAMIDNLDRRGVSNTVGVVVDNTAPRATVETLADVFSPNGDGVDDTMQITQTTSGADTWAGELVRADRDNVVRTEIWTADPPARIIWEGMTDRDMQASPGEYRYVLTGWDDAGNSTTVESDSFLLDLNIAEVDINVSPKPFTPDGDGRQDTVTFELSVQDRSSIASWQLAVYSPADTVFYEQSGEGAPMNSVTWDGRNAEGELVQAAEDYTVSLRVTDEAGNESATQATVPVGILVTEEEDGDYKIRITSIHFVPFEADYQNLEDPERVEQNMQVLDELASVLQEYPDHEIRIEGHAVHLTTGEDAREREQEQTLLPLSQDRAEAIRDALVERGVSSDRLSTTGVGGNEPVVPHTNEEERWKNRRVEFELIRR